MAEQANGQRPPRVEDITVREAFSELDAPDTNTVLVDVREPWEYAAGHARGAVSIPLSQFATRYAEIPQEQRVLVICEHGSRSLRAARFLAQQGYPDVANVDGGTETWRQAKLPMEQPEQGR